MTPREIWAHDIGWAVKEMHDGRRVRRAGWNGKGMFLFIITSAWTYTDGKQDSFLNSPCVAMKLADNKVVPWGCSQTDLLAVDWELAP